MAKFKLKPMVVEAVTFDELIEYGLAHTNNIQYDMPWSFTYKGIPITHETDDCYIIGGIDKFTRNDLLIIKDNNVSIVEKDAFDLISEQV